MKIVNKGKFIKTNLILIIIVGAIIGFTTNTYSKVETKYKEEYVLTNGKEPSCEEISKKLDCTTYDVVNALESLKDPVSMFEPIYSDGGDTIYLYDQIEDKRQTGSEMENRLATNDAITMLSDRCQQILEERFIIGKTQMEVAEDLAISQAQVSRLEKNAVKQLKRILK